MTLRHQSPPIRENTAFRARTDARAAPPADGAARADTNLCSVFHCWRHWADLTDGNLAAPINRDEIGAPVEAGVWTGTAIDGASYTEGDCDGFTNPSGGRALCGQSDASTESWTEDYVPPCSSYLRLYCLEQ